VTQLTGISLDTVKNALQFPQVWQLFRNWIETAAFEAASKVECAIDEVEVEVSLAAHNGQRFDFPLIFSSLMRCGMGIDDFEFNSQRAGLPSIQITGLVDSLHVFKKSFPDASNYKLGTLHQSIVGCEIENAHNALADVYAMRSIILAHEATTNTSQSDTSQTGLQETLCTSGLEIKAAWEEVDVRRQARAKLRARPGRAVEQHGQQQPLKAVAPPLAGGGTTALVFRTRTGAKYHKQTCKWCHRSNLPPIALTRAEAESSDLVACKICKP